MMPEPVTMSLKTAMIAVVLTPPATAALVVATVTPENISNLGMMITGLIGALSAAAIGILAAVVLYRKAMAEIRATNAATAKQLLDADAAREVQIAEVGGKTEAIKQSVDGAASKSLAKIEALEETIKQLVVERAKDEQRAAVLAQAATTKPGDAVSGSPVEASLTEIDKNTEETARNTARTDATVQDLKDKA